MALLRLVIDVALGAGAVGAPAPSTVHGLSCVGLKRQGDGVSYLWLLNFKFPVRWRVDV